MKPHGQCCSRCHHLIPLQSNESSVLCRPFCPVHLRLPLPLLITHRLVAPILPKRARLASIDSAQPAPSDFSHSLHALPNTLYVIATSPSLLISRSDSLSSFEEFITSLSALSLPNQIASALDNTYFSHYLSLTAHVPLFSSSLSHHQPDALIRLDGWVAFELQKLFHWSADDMSPSPSLPSSLHARQQTFLRVLIQFSVFFKVTIMYVIAIAASQCAGSVAQSHSLLGGLPALLGWALPSPSLFQAPHLPSTTLFLGTASLVPLVIILQGLHANYLSPLTNILLTCPPSSSLSFLSTLKSLLRRWLGLKWSSLVSDSSSRYLSSSAITPPHSWSDQLIGPLSSPLSPLLKMLSRPCFVSIRSFDSLITTVASSLTPSSPHCSLARLPCSSALSDLHLGLPC